MEKTISAENCGGSSVESGDLRCPSRRTPKASTDHGKATAGVGHILHEKQNFGRKKRFSFRICRKTFYFCTLKYHALTAPLCASAHSLDRISRQHVTHVPFAFAHCCAAPGRRRTDLVPERRHENRKRFGRLCRHEFQNRTTQTQGLPSHERQPERQRGHSRGERRTLSLHHRSAAGRHLQYRLAPAAHRPLQSGRHRRECTRRGRIARRRGNQLRHPNEQTKRTHRQSQRTPHRGGAIDRPHGAAHLPRRSARAPRTERFRHVDPRRQRRPSGTALHRHRSAIALERRGATL